MDAARIERKRLGGAMRQAGMLAAAGLVGLNEGITRLAEDHARARHIADIAAPYFADSGFDPTSVRTNIVVIDHPQARAIAAGLEEHGVLAGTVGPTRLRFVTHLDNRDDDLERLALALPVVMSSLPRG
jgi:threonine aldolase